MANMTNKEHDEYVSSMNTETHIYNLNLHCFWQKAIYLTLLE